MSIMSIKSVATMLVLAVIVGLIPQAQAASVKLVIAGASSQWQSMALGAYNAGNCPADGTKPCFHWTSGKNALSLRDTRPEDVGGTASEDAGTVWVVWDSAATVNVWVFIKEDSVVGTRCFFGSPACEIYDVNNPTTNSDWTAAGANQIASNLWGDDSVDTNLTSSATNAAEVLALVEAPANLAVNVAATDIRPEDAWWAIQRVNSLLGASSVGGANSDSLDGLGYNSTNASGVGPSLGTASCTRTTLAQGVGTPVYSAYQQTGTSSDAANVLAFNITGYDPFSCTKLAAYDVGTVGVAPIVFVSGRENNLGASNGGPVTNATEAQLQQAFSGTNADASAFGLPAASIDVYLRDPLSGTYNVAEATVFRYPTLYSSASGSGTSVAGLSQETGVGAPTPGTAANPLQLASAGSGLGFRYRTGSTSDEVNSVQQSTDGNGKSPNVYPNTNHVDGIGYTFFSYGNVSPLADSTKYGYIQLNGIDPIFQSYAGGFDPGQPTAANGTIPGGAETTFPKCEKQIWGGGLSFPNVRAGLYPAWSLLRLVYGSANSSAATDLITASNKYAVGEVPDYIPLAKVALTATGFPSCNSAAFTDPGFLLVRSHYQQLNGADAALGKAPVNTPGSTEAGGDMGGFILASSSLLTQATDNGTAAPSLRPSK